MLSPEGRMYGSMSFGELRWRGNELDALDGGAVAKPRPRLSGDSEDLRRSWRLLTWV